MGILSIFDVKKDFTYLQTSGILDKLETEIRSQVIAYVQKEMNGSDKMSAVVTAVSALIAKEITPVNPVLGAIFTVLAPQLIQYAYNLLKEYVDGLTATPPTQP